MPGLDDQKPKNRKGIKMKANINPAMTAIALIFAVTLLFVSSSPIADLSMKGAIQGWFAFLFYTITATLLISGVFAGIARALESKEA
jgi:hypothetical protein